MRLFDFAFKENKLQYNCIIQRPLGERHKFIQSQFCLTFKTESEKNIPYASLERQATSDWIVFTLTYGNARYYNRGPRK